MNAEFFNAYDKKVKCIDWKQRASAKSNINYPILTLKPPFAM